MIMVPSLNRRLIYFLIFIIIAIPFSWVAYRFYSLNNQSPSPVSSTTLPSVDGQPREAGLETKEIQENQVDNQKKSAPISQKKTHPEATPATHDFDVSKVQQSVSNLYSGTEDEQIEAIKLLSKIGTPEQKEVMREYALDPSKGIAVRLAVVENMDWEQDQNIDVAKTLITANGENKYDNGIREDVMDEASSADLSDGARDEINDAVYSAFDGSVDPTLQLAILEYFLEQNSRLFDDIAAQITPDKFGNHPEDRESLEEILQKRNEQKNDSINIGN